MSDNKASTTPFQEGILEHIDNRTSSNVEDVALRESVGKSMTDAGDQPGIMSNNDSMNNDSNNNDYNNKNPNNNDVNNNDYNHNCSCNTNLCSGQFG